MSDSFVTIILILIAATMLFMVPMIAVSHRKDVVSTQTVQAAINEFVDSTRKTGKVTQEEFSNLVQTLETTGETYEVNININNIDENPSKKDTSSVVDQVKIGENIYYTEYTTQVEKKLEEKGELLKETVFQDGTKIESRAGKYTFVWKGAVIKNAEKCEKRLRQYLNKANELGLSLLLEEGNDFQSVYNELIVVKNKIKEMDLPFDAPLKKGRGNKQKRLVKHDKQRCEDLKKVNDYDILLALIGDNRNSMSKTDPDATFMRMKEDSMGNGQLKPGYNIQIAADANYIVGATISCDRTDYETCIPMIEKLEEKLDWKYTNSTNHAIQ